MSFVLFSSHLLQEVTGLCSLTKAECIDIAKAPEILVLVASSFYTGDPTQMKAKVNAKVNAIKRADEVVGIR